MILSIGEILADMIGTKQGRHVELECFAGGAPFNVAVGIARLGGQVNFLGCVGQDEVGDFLKAYAAEEGLSKYIQTDDTRNTTIAFVTLNEEGERSFSFLRNHTADYALSISSAKELIAKADLVHIGSLMLSEEKGREFAEAVYAFAKERGKRVSFDVNYREDIFQSAEEAKGVYASWLSRADVLKLSEDEVQLFFGEKKEEELKRLSVGRKVFVTLGKHGSVMYENGAATSCPSINVQVTDTTGAGDAFYAGVLTQIDRGVTDAQQILSFANVCGALATTKHGATEALPNQIEVERLLKK